MKVVANAEISGAGFDHIRPQYLEALTLVERLHRQLLQVIKDEFARRSRAEINSVQALLLYNIGGRRSSPRASFARAAIILAPTSLTISRNSSRWAFSTISAR